MGHELNCLCLHVGCAMDSWAQSAIGSFEVELKKRGKYTEPLSVQQLLDCVRTSSSNGCKGGTPMDALAWLKKHGAATEREYPYMGVQGRCKTRLGKKGPLSIGWHKAIPACTTAHCDNQFRFELDLMLQVKNQGPFIAYVDARSVMGSCWSHTVQLSALRDLSLISHRSARASFAFA
jgi:hypothetical protein